jgi:hypothetical protein
MATREINGNTYSEFAVVAGEPLPVSQGLQVPAHDSGTCTYTDGKLTGVSWSKDGSVVATLAITYNGDGKLSTYTLSPS